MSEQASLLDVILRPPPPLPPRVLLVILTIVTAVNATFALFFVLRGAWPMLPFMGADVALLGWAFRASSRAAKREEHVTLTPSLLRIARRQPKSAPSEFTFNPYWVRVEMAAPFEHSSQLTLWSHGRSLKLGSFLPPQERALFAERLRDALRAVRAVPA
jgi:uncharacterized membrane protein